MPWVLVLFLFITSNVNLKRCKKKDNNIHYNNCIFINKLSTLNFFLIFLRLQAISKSVSQIACNLKFGFSDCLHRFWDCLFFPKKRVFFNKKNWWYDKLLPTNPKKFLHDIIEQVFTFHDIEKFVGVCGEKIVIWVHQKYQYSKILQFQKCFFHHTLVGKTIFWLKIKLYDICMYVWMHIILNNV